MTPWPAKAAGILLGAILDGRDRDMDFETWSAPPIVATFREISRGVLPAD